jgi:hypothetical protein
MKASHFKIGNPGLNPANFDYATRLPSNESPKQERFSVEEARKRLGQASWIYGQSPMKYQSVQNSSFYSPGPAKGLSEELTLAKK